MANLAFFDELCKSADCLFDARVGINAMLIVEINVVSPQAAQAAFAGFANVVGLATYAASVGIAWIAHDAKFGCNDQLVALAFDCPAH